MLFVCCVQVLQGMYQEVSLALKHLQLQILLLVPVVISLKHGAVTPLVHLVVALEGLWIHLLVSPLTL